MVTTDMWNGKETTEIFDFEQTRTGTNINVNSIKLECMDV